MNEKIKEEYLVLTEKLEEVDWALRGSCNDIDCDKYMYKELLKKRYKPVLEHNYSCMKKLKLERGALLRILSAKKYRKLRYVKCKVCKKELDTLGNYTDIIAFSKKFKSKNINGSEVMTIQVHKKCKFKVKIPEGWKKL